MKSSAKILDKLKTSVAPESLTQGITINLTRNALVGKKVGAGRKVSIQKKVVEKEVEQVIDINSVVQTQSGRNIMKKIPFKAGKN